MSYIKNIAQPENLLKRHSVAARWHGEAQEAAHSQARADDGEREEGEERGGGLQFVEREIAEGQAVRAVGEETQESRALLHAAEGVERHPGAEREQQVDAEADGSQARAKQPEAFAQPLAFARGLDAARRPDRRDQELQQQEEQGRGNEHPVRENSRRDERAQPPQRVEDNTLYYPAPVAGLIKHTG